MKKNMGRCDRTLRLIAALVIAVLLIAGLIKGTWAIILAILAVILVLTTLVGYCPLYTPMGVSTGGSKKTGESTPPSK